MIDYLTAEGMALDVEGVLPSVWIYGTEKCVDGAYELPAAKIDITHPELWAIADAYSNTSIAVNSALVTIPEIIQSSLDRVELVPNKQALFEGRLYFKGDIVVDGISPGTGVLIAAICDSDLSINSALNGPEYLDKIVQVRVKKPYLGGPDDFKMAQKPDSLKILESIDISEYLEGTLVNIGDYEELMGRAPPISMRPSYCLSEYNISGEKFFRIISPNKADYNQVISNLYQKAELEENQLKSIDAHLELKDPIFAFKKILNKHGWSVPHAYISASSLPDTDETPLVRTTGICLELKSPGGENRFYEAPVTVRHGMDIGVIADKVHFKVTNL
jgi:hypothetical protein